MKKIKSISLNLSGSFEEGLLISSINEEETDGISGNGMAEWPFNIDGSSIFDSWYDSNNWKIAPIEIGKKLYDSLFSASFKSTLNEIIAKSKSYDKVLIKIKTNDNPLLSRIPFEIIHNEKFFLFSGNRTLVRYIDDKSEIYPTNQPLKRILFILSEPLIGRYSKWGRDDYKEELIEMLGKLGIGNYKIIESATIEIVKKELMDSSDDPIPYSSIFVIAHGESAKGSSDGFLIFETEKGEDEQISSSTFNSFLNGHNGCFVFLCSCYSGAVAQTNPFASVGHQLIHNGCAGAVLCMQRPVKVGFGLAMVKSIIESLNNSQNIFKAYYDSLTLQLSKPDHGVPCLYSRPVKEEIRTDPFAEPDYFKEFNRVKSVLSIDTNKSRFVLIFPGFIMGFKPSIFKKFRLSWLRILLRNQYSYGNLTTAKTDISAGKGIIALLGKVFKLDELDKRILVETDDNTLKLLEDPRLTHFVFFGSKSHSFSRQILTQYSEDFVFSYSKENWSIIDKRSDKVYSVPNPNKYNSNNLNHTDYAIIEKIIDDKSGKVIIIIAGMWDTSTMAAGNFLLENIDRLYKKFGNGGFQLLLSVEVGKTEIENIIIERSPKKNE